MLSSSGSCSLPRGKGCVCVLSKREVQRFVTCMFSVRRHLVRALGASAARCVGGGVTSLYRVTCYKCSFSPKNLMFNPTQTQVRYCTALHTLRLLCWRKDGKQKRRQKKRCSSISEVQQVSKLLYHAYKQRESKYCNVIIILIRTKQIE